MEDNEEENSNSSNSNSSFDDTINARQFGTAYSK